MSFFGLLHPSIPTASITLRIEVNPNAPEHTWEITDIGMLACLDRVATPIPFSRMVARILAPNF